MGVAFEVIVLDIEGTICPISFVHDKLFPYAAANVESFLKDDANFNHPDVKNALGVMKEDAEKEIAGGDNQIRAIKDTDKSAIPDIVHNVKHWIKLDKKLPGLKELQGRIWRVGYESGQLKSELFPDVITAIKQLFPLLEIYTYSSGSIEAQQLLLQYTAGDYDLGGHIRCCFSLQDIGHKREVGSYVRLADACSKDPAKILFVTDVEQEAAAAKEAGMQTMLMVRPGNAPLSEYAKANYEIIYNMCALMSQEMINEISKHEQDAHIDALRKFVAVCRTPASLT